MKTTVTTKEAAEILSEAFSTLPDPRVVGRTLHPLMTVIGIALLSTICGAQTFTDMTNYAESNEEFLSEYFDLSNGIPSHWTFARVFASIQAESFNQCLVGWTSKLSGNLVGRNIAVDGKTVRGSKSKDKRPTHIVSAFWSDAGLVLGQEVVDDKSNEITAIPIVLEAINLQEGDTVTIDAMGTQREIAKQIDATGAAYILAVKGNQPNLNEEILLQLSGMNQKQMISMANDHWQNTEKGHGRIEERSYFVFNQPTFCQELANWQGCMGIGVAVRSQITGENSKETRRYYIFNKEFSAKDFGSLVRGHWGIENSLHHVLDVTMGEDMCRARVKQAAQNLSTLRKQALTIIDAGRPKGTSKRGAIKIAGWSNQKLRDILRGWAQKMV